MSEKTESSPEPQSPNQVQDIVNVEMTSYEAVRWREVYRPIEQERQRQIGLGYTPEHDEAHGGLRHLIYNVAANYAMWIGANISLNGSGLFGDKDSQGNDLNWERATQIALKLAATCVAGYEFALRQKEIEDVLPSHPDADIRDEK